VSTIAATSTPSGTMLGAAAIRARALA
jgi:hypothetical protein